MKTLWVLLLMVSNDPNPRWHPPLADIAEVLVDVQVLDPREVTYLFMDEASFVHHLEYARDKFWEVWNAPLLHEVYFTLDKDTLLEMRIFNTKCQEDAREKQLLHPAFAEDYEPHIQEMKRRYEIIDACHDARCDFYYVWVRRRSLKRLRDELLGPAAFYSGYVPAAVQASYFRRFD